MRVARTFATLAVAPLAAGSIGDSGAGGTTQDAEGIPAPAWTSLVASPLAPARPVLATDGRMHLVYELLVTNVSSSVMTLEQLETLDASTSDAADTERGVRATLMRR